MTKVEQLYRFPDACIAMFARAPFIGQVKTRLIPALGEQGALDLHIWLMQRQIMVLNSSQLSIRQLWVDRVPEHSAFKNFEGEIKLQQGESLGDKMCNTLQVLLKHFSRVLIIGSDCAELDETYLEQALQNLNDPGVDVVIGPARDGGYVLIGMKQPHQELFQGIQWGSESVRQDTLNIIRSIGLQYSELLPLRDIDTADDLKSLL